MSSYLVVSALGENQKGLVNELASLASTSGCNIVDSRMTLLGNEFAVIMLLKGEWNALAKMQHHLPTVARSLGLTTMIQRTTAPQIPTGKYACRVQVVARDNPGIIKDIAFFFNENNIDIIDLQSDSYSSSKTGETMVVLNLRINIHSAILIESVRENFRLFCETLNLEMTLEPLLDKI